MIIPRGFKKSQGWQEQAADTLEGSVAGRAYDISMQHTAELAHAADRLFGNGENRCLLAWSASNDGRLARNIQSRVLQLLVLRGRPQWDLQPTPTISDVPRGPLKIKHPVSSQREALPSLIENLPLG